MTVTFKRRLLANLAVGLLGLSSVAVVTPAVAAPVCDPLGFTYTVTGATNDERLVDLAAAVECANTTPAADIIDLGGQTLTMSAVIALSGGSGVGTVTQPLTVQNGRIDRVSTAPAFRFFEVAASGSLTLDRVTLAGGSGGGTVDNGAASDDGGAVYVLGVLNLVSSRITASVGTFGGAVFYSNGSSGAIINSLLDGNAAGSTGGAVRARGTLTIVNSTIAGNRAGQGGGVACAGAGSVTLQNSIIALNAASTSANSDCSLVPQYSILGSDPGFVGAVAPASAPSAAGDYSLAAGSAAIDAGSNAFVPSGIVVDLAGAPRFVDEPNVVDTGVGTAPIVDIGARERLPEFTVTFAASGGAPTPAAEVVALGQLATEPAAPARAGYSFDGWWHNGARWNFASDTVAADTTLVAQWLLLPTISGQPTADAPLDAPFSWTPTISATSGYTVTSTALPAGLLLDPGTGAISGMPTSSSGQTAVTLTVSDANGTASFDLTITVTHGTATSLIATASNVMPTVGDTVTVTVVAQDAYGNTWDVSASSVITSSVATDVVVGNTVRFEHASPHLLTAQYGSLTASALVEVTAVLAATGSDLPLNVILASVLSVLAGVALLFIGKRSRRSV